MSTALASLLKNSASALPSPLPARHTHTVLTHLGLGCDPSRAWLPPRQKLPDSDFHLVEACGGWGPTGFLGGSALPQPAFTPRIHLMGISSSKGSCTPRSPGQSLSHWGGASAIRGLWGGRGWQGLNSSKHRRGGAGRTRPEPARAQRGQVRSLQCPLPPLRRVPGQAWGPRAVWSESGTRPHGQDTAVGLGPAPRSPPPWPAFQPIFLCPFHTVDTGALVSAVPRPARTGEEGQAEEQPPLIGHRDVPNLFILVKRKVKTTLHCIRLAP